MRIIAATDLTPSGRRAIDLAAEIASANGGQLELVHVTDLPPERSTLAEGSEIEPALDALRARLRQRVEESAAALEKERARCAARGIECETRLLEGHPWEAIVEEAARWQATLLVVGSHGWRSTKVLRETIRERLLGSTADRAVRFAPCPVLVAIGEGPPEDLRGATWLVGVDFSPASTAAVRLAGRLAAATGGRLALAHAVAPTGIDEEETTEPSWRQVLREESRKEAERRLRKLAEAAGGGTATYEGERISHGPPAQELCTATRETGARILVVGSHGKKGLTRLLLGSTAERCLRLSHVPVLVVRPEDVGAATTV